MTKIYHLRRIGLLLIMFGLGLLVGGNTNPLLQTIYLTSIVLWLMIYDLAMEKKEDKDD